MRRGVKRGFGLRRRTSAASCRLCRRSARRSTRRLFRYVRTIPPRRAGLVTIPLDEAVLAHSQGAAFADVRVLDASNRQVPYLVERASEPLSLDLTIEPVHAASVLVAAGSKRMTRLSRAPAARAASLARASCLTTSARVFSRRVAVGVEHGPDRRQRDPWFETLATSNWSHADQDSPAPALTMTVRPLEGRDVFVTVEEGDNSPLPLASARLLLPAYRLRLFRQRDAALRLAYGRDDLGLPQYDLALIAPQLTGVAATEVMPGPEPTAAPESPLMLMSPRLFWGVLIVAVLVLVTLVVRLVKKSDVQSTPAT